MKNVTILKNWFFLLFSFFTFYGLLSSYNFPFAGLSILGVCLSLILLIAKKVKTIETYFWFIISILFSTFLVVYSNSTLTFFNLILIFYSQSALISSSQKISLTKFIFWPVLNFFTALNRGTDNDFSLLPKLFPEKNKIEKPKDETPKDRDLTKKILSGIITFLVVIIFTAILSSANPYFASLISNFFQIFNFAKLWQFILWIRIDYLFDLRTYFALLLAFILKRTVAFLQNSKLQDELSQEAWLKYQENLKKINQKMEMLWPKSGGAIVILIFIITQIELYLATSGALKSLGITYQDRVHEVFFQLLFVSLIVLGLIFVDISKEFKHKSVGYILLVEAFLLTLSGLKSDIEYVSGFGLGPQRLYGFAVILFSIFAIILTFLVIQNRQDSSYFKRLLASVSLIFVLINFINFDKIIIDYNNANGKDTEIQSLSADSGAWDEGYLKSLKTVENRTEVKPPINTGSNEFEMTNLTIDKQTVLKDKIKYLQNKYQNLNWIDFNFSEYKQYQEVKDLKVE